MSTSSTTPQAGESSGETVQSPFSRRDFLRSAAAGAAAATAFGILNPARAQGGDVLRVGLIGCGGRGTGAAREALLADPNTQLVAVADVFADMAENSVKRLKTDRKIADRVVVDDGHRFVGFDAYKGVIETCDVIVHATPPGFRPQHLRA
ncbi:MAG TPA: twin-arginine translocation signal domain-containing protein, partial [Candidatus Hydrogenedentes bacterium]|nr:twin-arginine translocation signal domain-containing protein [Candidatus Hydrogenedentota bacterium]